MNWLKELFSDGGNASIMRVMSCLVCITGCSVALITHDAVLTGVLLASAFGGKVAQKAVEVKNGQ